jgi:hypothetical protein
MSVQQRAITILTFVRGLVQLWHKWGSNSTSRLRIGRYTADTAIGQKLWNSEIHAYTCYLERNSNSKVFYIWIVLTSMIGREKKRLWSKTVPKNRLLTGDETSF